MMMGTPTVHACKGDTIAVDHGAQVINLIFGSFTPSLLSISRAVCGASNVLLVAARRERQKRLNRSIPSAFTGVLAVRCDGPFRHKGYFSSYGSHVFGAGPELTYFSAYPLGYYSIFRVHPSVRPRLRRRRQLYVPCERLAWRIPLPAGLFQYRWPKSNLRAAVREPDASMSFRCPGRNPAITTVNPAPASRPQLDDLGHRAITHSNQATTQLSLGADVTITNVVVANPTSLTHALNIAATATPGTRTLTVTTSAEVATLDIPFTVAQHCGAGIGRSSQRQAR